MTTPSPTHLFFVPVFCHAFSCFDNLVSYRPLVWCILVFDWISKRYAFESSFKLVNRLNLSKNWFRTVCTVHQKSSINSVLHVTDTIENVLWSSFYCPTYQCDKLCLPCCGYNRERSMKFVLLPTYQCDKLCLPCCGYNRERSVKFVLLPTYQEQ